MELFTHSVLAESGDSLRRSCGATAGKPSPHSKKGDSQKAKALRKWPSFSAAKRHSARETRRYPS